MATMHLEVVSAEQHVLSAEVTELYARSVEGEIGILPGHQPALIGLDIGSVRAVLEDGTRATIAVHRGMLFVDRDNKVVVLADVAELSDDIDVERARTRRERILAELETHENDAALKVSLRKQELRLDIAANG
ncbi:MAG: ATP synthase F1 subunit epsilon [Nitriliruptoraceae bacterium]